MAYNGVSEFSRSSTPWYFETLVQKLKLKLSDFI